MVKGGDPSHRLSGVLGGTGVGSHRVNQAPPLGVPSLRALRVYGELTCKAAPQHQ